MSYLMKSASNIDFMADMEAVIAEIIEWESGPHQQCQTLCHNS